MNEQFAVGHLGIRLHNLKYDSAFRNAPKQKPISIFGCKSTKNIANRQLFFAPMLYLPDFLTASERLDLKNKLVEPTFSVSNLLFFRHPHFIVMEKSCIFVHPLMRVLDTI